MTFKEKSRVMNPQLIQKALKRMAHEIIEKNKGTEQLAIIGIRSRGAYLAKRIAENIEQISGQAVAQGVLDVTLYRDDLNKALKQPEVQKTEINFDITGKKIVLVDDVLYSGRTIRAALDALIDFGRPEYIQLAVLIDRGHRELPIRADYIGKNVPSASREQIQVRLEEIDGKDEVIVAE